MARKTSRKNEIKYVLGVHLGASSQHIGISDQSGKILVEQSFREPPSIRLERRYQDILDGAVTSIGEVLKEAGDKGCRPSSIGAAGVIVPAAVDTERGFVRRAPSVRGFENVFVGQDLRQRLQGETGIDIPFFVENDANGYALAEASSRGKDAPSTFVIIYLCTGLGGGLMLEGSLYRGHTNMAGEIGHVVIHPNGRPCPCGGRGCLETVASGAALLREVKYTKSPLAAKNGLHYLDLVEAAQNGDEEIRSLFLTMGQNLGIGVASIINILNPAEVILTGKLAQAADFFMPSVQEELNNRAYPGMNWKVSISKLRVHPELLAAVSTCLHYRKNSRA